MDGDEEDLIGLCNPCLRTIGKKKADFWCGACADNLCAVCEETHQKLKFTRHHFTLPLQDKEKVREKLRQIPVTCGLHIDQPFTHYCDDHDEVICAICVRNIHRTCNAKTEINQIVKNSDFRNKFRRKTHEILENLQTHLTEYDTEKQFVTDQRHEILEEIREFRNEINQTLDVLEKKLTRVLEQKIQTKIDAIETSRQKLLSVQSYIMSVGRDMDVITQYGNTFDQQLFILMYFLRKDIEEEFIDINNMSTEEGHVIFRFQRNNVMPLIPDLGRIYLQSSQNGGDIAKDKNKSCRASNKKEKDYKVKAIRSNCQSETGICSEIEDQNQGEVLSEENINRESDLNILSETASYIIQSDGDSDSDIPSTSLTTNNNTQTKRPKTSHLQVSQIQHSWSDGNLSDDTSTSIIETDSDSDWDSPSTSYITSSKREKYTKATKRLRSCLKAQHQEYNESKSNREINTKRQKRFHLKTKFNLDKNLLSNKAVSVDRCIFFGSKLVLADIASEIVFVCEKSGKLVNSITCKVNDLAYSSEGKLFIAIEDEGIFQLQDESNYSFCPCLALSTEEKYYNVSSFQNKLAIVTGKKKRSVKIVDLKKERVVHRVCVNAHPVHVCCDIEGNIYQTSKDDDTVISYNHEGNLLYKFKNPDLKNARGLAADNFSRLYVCGYDSNNIIRISSDGSSYDVILGEEDGITNPFDIDVDKETGDLVIINQNHESVEIYQLGES